MAPALLVHVQCRGRSSHRAGTSGLWLMLASWLGAVSSALPLSLCHCLCQAAVWAGCADEEGTYLRPNL